MFIPIPHLNRYLILASLIVLVLFATVSSLISGTTVRVQAFTVPPECASLSITSVVYATSPVTVVPNTDVVIVIGLPHANNTIVIQHAAQACVLGGDKTNSISGGPGNDVIIGRSSQSAISGGPGNDTCYGTLLAPPHPVNINCETVLP